MHPTLTHDWRAWSNATWIAALRSSGAEGTVAARNLTQFLQRVARKLLRSPSDQGEVEDLAQESLARILAHLSSFRGDSAFTTWAAAVTTRVVFEHLRRAAVRRRGDDAFRAAQQAAEAGTLPAQSLSTGLEREQVLAALQHAIEHSITPRQRTAILAELRGIPTIEIASRMGTNTNALYKLTHDARKALRRYLVSRGFDGSTIEDLQARAES